MRLSILAALLLSACATSTASIAPAASSASAPPGLAVAGAPPGSMLFVDGKNTGTAMSYDPAPKHRAPLVLRVAPGAHEVEIVDPTGRTLHKQRVVAEADVTTIRVQ
jgi:hypothetical protein